MSKRTEWAIKVHAGMLTSGLSLTNAEIVERYGESPGAKSASSRMWDATQSGWFSVEKVPGSGNANRYTALPKAERYDWTPEREALLAKWWPVLGPKCAPMFAPATPYSVKSHASVMGLRILPKVKVRQGGHPPREAEPSRDNIPRVRSVFELGSAA